jgi:hypothetical protein
VFQASRLGDARQVYFSHHTHSESVLLPLLSHSDIVSEASHLKCTMKPNSCHGGSLCLSATLKRLPARRGYKRMKQARLFITAAASTQVKSNQPTPANHSKFAPGTCILIIPWSSFGWMERTTLCIGNRTYMGFDLAIGVLLKEKTGRGQRRLAGIATCMFDFPPVL